MTGSRAWRLCALAGLATLAISRGFGLIPHLVPCGASGGASAVIALEMARNPAELLALFGGGAAPCAARLATAQTTALWLDMLAFIPAYGAFLLFGAVALAKTGSRIAAMAPLAIVAAALLDEAEGIVLFLLIPMWSNPPDLFGALFWTVRPKFALLGVAEMMLGAALLSRGWLHRVSGLVMLVGGAASLWFLFTAPRDPQMMLAHSLAWAALLVVALGATIASFRRVSASPPWASSAS